MNRAMRRTKSGLYVPGDAGFVYDPHYTGEGAATVETTVQKRRRQTEAEKMSRAAAREELEGAIINCPPPGLVGDIREYAHRKATEVARRVEQKDSGRRP